MSTLRALKSNQKRKPKSKKKKTQTILEIATQDQLTTCAIFQKISKTSSSAKKQWKKVKKYLQIILDQEEEYEDPAFPPNNKTLNPLKNMRSKIKFISWFRIHHFFKKRKYSVFSQYKILNQSLPNKGFRYLIDSFNTLSAQPGLISRLFERKKISKEGIYSVWLNIHGKWTNLIIDDFLPIFRDTRNNSNFFLTSPNGDFKEIWYCLLEKALAKAYGGYDKMYGGLENYLVRDLTGAPYSVHNIPKIDKGKIKKIGDITDISQISSQIKRVLKKGHLISVVPRNQGNQNSKSKKYFSNLKSQKKLKKPISVNHNYALISLKEVKDAKGKNSRIVKLRTPYKESPWNGEWSLKSKAWTINLKKKLKVESQQKKGEFWMSVKDLMTHFETLNVYKTTPGHVYTSLEIDSLYQKYDRIVLRVKVPETGKYTFSVDQVDLRIFDNTALKYSSVKLTLGKLSHSSFKLLSHTSSSELRNSYIRKVLQEGEYYLLIEKKNTKINLKYTKSEDKKYSKLKKITISSYGPASAGLAQVEESPDNQVVYDYLCYHGWKDYSRNKPGQKLSDFKVNFYDGSWHNLSLHLLDIPDSVIYAFKNDNDFGVELKSEIKGIKNKEILGPHGRVSYSQNFLLNPESTDIFIIRKEQVEEDTEVEGDLGNFQINSIVGKKFDGVRENPESFFKVYEYLLDLNVHIEITDVERDEGLKKGVGIFNVDKGCVKIENEKIKLRKSGIGKPEKDRYEDIVEILESARGRKSPGVVNFEIQEKDDDEQLEDLGLVSKDIKIEEKSEELKYYSSSQLKFADHELSDLINVEKEKIEKIEKNKLKDLIEFYGIKEFISVFEVKEETLEFIASRFKQDTRISEMMNGYLESTDFNQTSKDEFTEKLTKKKINFKEESLTFTAEKKKNFENMMDKTQRDVLLNQIGKMKTSMKNKLKSRQRIPSMFRYQLDTSRGGDSSVSHSNRISIDKSHQRLEFSSLGKKLLKDQRSKTERHRSFRTDKGDTEKKLKMKLKVKSKPPGKSLGSKSKKGLLDVIKDISNERNSSESVNSYFGSKLSKIKKSNEKLKKRLRGSILKKIESIKESTSRIENLGTWSMKRKTRRMIDDEAEVIDIDELNYPQSPNYNKYSNRNSIDYVERRKTFNTKNRRKLSGSISDRIFSLRKSQKKNINLGSAPKFENLPQRNQRSFLGESRVEHSLLTIKNDSQKSLGFRPEIAKFQNFRVKNSQTERNNYISSVEKNPPVNKKRIYTQNIDDKYERNSVGFSNSIKHNNNFYLSNQLENEIAQKTDNLLFYTKKQQQKNSSINFGKDVIHRADSTRVGKYSSVPRNPVQLKMRQNQSTKNLAMKSSEFIPGNLNQNQGRIFYTDDKLKLSSYGPQQDIKRGKAIITSSRHRRQLSDEPAWGNVKSKDVHESSMNKNPFQYKSDGHNLNYQHKIVNSDQNKHNNLNDQNVTSSLQLNDANRLMYKILAKKNSNDVNYRLKQKLNKRASTQNPRLVLNDTLLQKNSFLKGSDYLEDKRHELSSNNYSRHSQLDRVNRESRGYFNKKQLPWVQNQIYQNKALDDRKSFRKSPSFTQIQSSGTQDLTKKFSNFGMSNTPKGSNQVQISQILKAYGTQNMGKYEKVDLNSSRGYVRTMGQSYSKTPKGGGLGNQSLIQNSNLISGREAYGGDLGARVRLPGGAGKKEGVRILGYKE